MNDLTFHALRYCLFAGIALIAAGLVLSEHEYGDSIMWIGLLILIASPFVGIIASFSGLVLEKDNRWAMVALILIAVILIGLVISFLFR
jgi:uncharacterized membrane protein